MAAEQADPRAAGWKRDPTGRFVGRYWNGERWTEHVVNLDRVTSVDPLPPARRPVRVAPAPVPAPDTKDRARRQATAIAFVGAAAVALGCFLPWSELTIPDVGSITKTGMDGRGGLAFLAIAALVALLAARVRAVVPEHPGRYQGALAVLILALVVIGAVQVSDIGGRLDAATRASDLVHGRYGDGIRLVGIGTAVVFAAWLRMPWRAMRPHKRSLRS